MIENECKSYGEAATTVNKYNAPTFKKDGLVLYYHPYNFGSQKVILYLHEQCIDFIPYAVDLSGGEQYAEWFLNLNPKGNVPVLQDGALIIPNSQHIINYIENNLAEKWNAHKRDHAISNEAKKKMQFYEQLLVSVPVGALSLGSFIHDDLKLVPKPPFIGPIRKACLKNTEIVCELLKKSIETVDWNRACLEKKLHFQEQRKKIVYSRQDYQQILEQLNNALRYMESELCKQSNDADWLIENEFSMADIHLGVLLYRLYQLGFENYYWANGKMPAIEGFFQRFKQRDTFQKLVPNNFEILKDIWQKTPANYKLGASAGVGVIGMAVFAALAHK